MKPLTHKKDDNKRNLFRIFQRHRNNRITHGRGHATSMSTSMSAAASVGAAASIVGGTGVGGDDPAATAALTQTASTETGTDVATGAATTMPTARAGNPKTTASRQNILTDGEKLLANELSNLTLAEREHVYSDIHGIPTSQAEDPERVQQSLRDLEREISLIRKKVAYSKAVFLAPAPVKSHDMRTNMLRKAGWDPVKAAEFLVQFYELRNYLFGPDHLTRPLTFDDLPEDAQTSIRSGGLLVRDLGNDHHRRFLVLNYKHFHFRTTMAFLQAIWYLMEMVEALDHSVIGNHIVIANMIGATGQQYRIGLSSIRHMSQLGITDCMPAEMTSTHLCFENPRIKPFVSLVMLTSPRHVRLRTKLHYGNLPEIALELATYGVPREMLHFEPEAYVQELRRSDAALLQESDEKKPSDCYHSPRQMDVVMGRGRPYQQHPGNVALIDFLRGRPHRDIQLTVVSQIYVDQIKTKGVRFLKRRGLYWEEISDDEARQKVRMTLRNISRGVR